MATLVIRYVDDAVRQALERLAASHGRSLEAAAWEMLRVAAGRGDESHGDENVASDMATRMSRPTWRRECRVRVDEA